MPVKRMHHHLVTLPFILTIAIIALLISACNTLVQRTSPSAAEQGTTNSTICPDQIKASVACYTPETLRQAYGVNPLIKQGYTGKGQTVVVIVSYGSPTLQADFDVFSKQFGLPALKLQIYSPLGTASWNDPGYNAATINNMQGWAQETSLDVESIHAMAPDAKIVVMTSPIAETEGLIGLPQFMSLEEYAVQHHLGNIISQSWGASEATLNDDASKKFLRSFSDFYQKATTTEGITFLTGSGDNGATDYTDVATTMLADERTTSFPSDVPWVTSIGGTELLPQGNGYNETAWNGSGGGNSKIFPEPSFQTRLSSNLQEQIQGGRAVPDIAAQAFPATSMAYYTGGTWIQIGGTSASTPTWAGILAIADQIAGHGLGFINPALYTIGEQPTKYKQDFRDITLGNNTQNQGGTAQAGKPFYVAGFQATTGWDEVTGWGSPLASSLIPDLIQSIKS